MLLAELRAAGFAVSCIGSALYVEPASRLTAEQRAGIRRHKPEMLRELGAEAGDYRDSIARARDAAPLEEYREALITGRLCVCANCERFRFAAMPAQPGTCSEYAEEVSPFLPFSCPAFKLSEQPVVPAYTTRSPFMLETEQPT